jgi:Zn-dependent protease with chaperone function
MNPSYLLRLLCLSLACFFLVNLVLGAMVEWGASRCVRLADRMKPRTAARFLLTLRLFPGLGAVLAVAGICVPSYLWLEPRGATEDIGAACLAAALMGAMICGISIVRTASALAASRRYIRDCRRAGEEILIAGQPVWVVEGTGRIVALAGMFRTRVLISEEAISALEADEAHAVLRHERGHAVSRDNLKRLALTLAPDVAPFVRRGFSTIERAWAKFAEWAADDYAAMGDPALSMSLASALVRVARIPAGAATPAFLTPFMDGDFSARVDRLLADPVALNEPPYTSRPWAIAFWASIGAAAGIALLLSLRPATLLSAHALLERLIK